MTYNLTLVLKSSLKEADKKKTLDAVKAIFGKAKFTEKEWGQKPLAYPIKKEVSGLFINWKVEAEEVLAKDFERKIIIIMIINNFSS